MSCTSEPLTHSRVDEQQEHRLALNVRNGTEQAPEPNYPLETSPFPTKRSDVLRYVFPRPSAPEDTSRRRSAPRVAKAEQRKAIRSSFRQSRPRVAFHRVITSIFNHSPARTASDPGSPQAESSASSIHSKLGTPYESSPSMEVLSPGTFLFSSPSLRSAYSGSLSNSTSRLPSLAEPGSESYSLRRVRSECISADSNSLLEDGIMEPFVERGIARSMSDVLLGTGTSFEELGEAIIEESDEEDHVFMAQLPRRCHSTGAGLEVAIARLLLPYLDLHSWKTLRLTTRSWQSALGLTGRPKFPSSYYVPTEILQHIYDYLSPKDFNAVRHTCRNWMRASLDKKLLVTMLKRGGWWSGAEMGLDQRGGSTEHGAGATGASDEWFLSRRLSRECSLAAGWTGNGIDLHRPNKPFEEVSEIDFTDFASGCSGTAGRHGAGLVFATSNCGRFLLVARETLVYVYGLLGISLQPLTSVTCPRRVLSMSMDVSSGRNAVAALLEGRMGMVCELRFGHSTGSESPVDVHMETHTHHYRTTTRTSIVTSRANGFEAALDVANRTSSRTHRSNQPVTDRESWTAFSSVDVQANHDTITLHGTDNHRMYDQNWINHAWNLDLRGPPSTSRPAMSSESPSSCDGIIPIESGTSTFYRHLCSEDDPPRSVSICPQRRCVAFGCSAGIELHWIDALTGQSLSRWFPLTAPSDYLSFLPPRPGFESAKKLRLISSAAHPNDRGAMNRKFVSGRPTASSFWESFGFDNSGGRPGTSACDHFRAIPLSDGHHVLFIDPLTGYLFLGCDAPLGGPTKLLRKICLLPPAHHQVPRLYTAAADLTWGARIVTVFDDTLMFYSIPPDVLALSRLEQKAESWDIYIAPPFSTEARTRDHWLNWLEAHEEPRLQERSPIWPIAIRGTEIGTLRGVSEVAIVTHPEITIWAFALGWQSRTWQLSSEAHPTSRSRKYVCKSGIVHRSHSVDESGDVIIRDAKQTHASTSEASDRGGERSVGFDGHSSQILVKRIPKALHVENDEWIEQLDVRGCDAWYNMNGDVVMSGTSREPYGWEIEVVDEREAGTSVGC